MSTSQTDTFLNTLERRKAGRVRCSQTTCQLGVVANLSRDGCRVVSRRAVAVPEGHMVVLRLAVAGCEIAVPASLISCRARKDGKHDLGFKFTAIPDATRRELINVLRAALGSTDHLHRSNA